MVNISQREFLGKADLWAMAALVRDFPTGNVHVTDLPYRLSSWALDDPANIGLWFDSADQLIAWAVFQTPFWTIDLSIHPETDWNLRSRLWDWADQRALDMLDTPFGHPAWFVNVFADQVEALRDIEQVGFASQANVGDDSWSKVFMRRSTVTDPMLHLLPAGFSIRQLAGASEVDDYVELHRLVFESRNMTVEWRSRTLQQQEYIPELDLVAVAPNGHLVAFCVGWLSQDKSGETIGQIEPMGVHADYRHLGLGRAILSENVRRMHQYGARQVFIETDSYRSPALALYEAVGFREFREIMVYRKDYLVG